MQLKDKLESGLYCELTGKLLYDGCVEYTLLYDMIANRISIEKVQTENVGLRLMKNLVLEYDALPHALICGGTGWTASEKAYRPSRGYVKRLLGLLFDYTFTCILQACL